MWPYVQLLGGCLNFSPIAWLHCSYLMVESDTMETSLIHCLEHCELVAHCIIVIWYRVAMLD